MTEVRIHAVSDGETKRLMRKIERLRFEASQAGGGAAKDEAKASEKEVTKERDGLVVRQLRVRDAGRLDIVADLDERDPAQRPKHFIGGKLHAHDSEIVTEISVSRQESIVWIADRPFSIVKIEKSQGHHHGHNKPVEGSPRNPFYRAFPARSIKGHKDKWYRLGSGPAKPNAIDQHYKITLRFGRKLVDPDLVCMD